LEKSHNGLYLLRGRSLAGLKLQITVCQDIADSLDNTVRTDAIIIKFSKAFDLVFPCFTVLKIAASGVDQRIVVWIREFLLAPVERVRVGGQLSEEIT
jgi:hypothetical protein